MKKNLIYFLFGVILTAVWGYFTGLVDDGVKWAWWPYIILPLFGAGFNLFSRSETSTRLIWLLGCLVGAIIMGVIWYKFLSL